MKCLLTVLAHYSEAEHHYWNPCPLFQGLGAIFRPNLVCSFCCCYRRCVPFLGCLLFLFSSPLRADDIEKINTLLDGPMKLGTDIIHIKDPVRLGALKVSKQNESQKQDQ